MWLVSISRGLDGWRSIATSDQSQFLLLKSLSLTVACLATHGTWSLPAQAIGSLVDVTVINGHSGATLPVHYHCSNCWVVALVN